LAHGADEDALMGKPRLPYAQSFMSRDGTLGQIDSFLENGCIDKQGERLYVLKRPGTILNNDFGTGTDPQGGTFYNGLVYGVYSDTLYRTGGVIDVGTLGDAWTQGSVPAWYGRAFFTATVFGNRVFVIGGEGAQIKADISYSSDMVNWSQNASAAPFGHLQGHRACSFNGLLWVMGGTGGASVVHNDVWSSPDGANWTEVTAAAQWSARLNFMLVVGNNGMYVYGGEDGSGNLLDDVWFSSDGATWTELTAAATGTPRQLGAMFYFNNKLWIIGGYADVAGTTTINDVNSSPDGQTWTVTAPVFPTGKALMAYTIYDGKMWLIGGDAGGTIVSDVWSGDGSSWTLVTSAPGFTPRGGAEAINFATPTSLSQYRYATMWLLGGDPGDLQQVWYGNLDKPLPATNAFSPDVAAQPYQFNTFLNGKQLLIKNQSNFWVLQSGSLTKVTDTNYPSQTVPGLVVLNSFAYVMEPDGTIRACALEDPLHWPSLQFIVADYEDDPGVAIAKYLNYLVAFGQYTTQFYYDAGNPAPGIALSPYQSTNIKIGCSFASTLQSAKNTLIWVGQTKERNPGVYVFDGLNPKRVSTKWVDKVINNNINSQINAWVTGMEGHTFYVLQFLNTMAICYDMDTGEWGPWSSNVEGDQSMPYSIALTEFFAGGDLWFGRSTFGGQVYRASFETFDDGGTEFKLRSQTTLIDDGSLVRKFWGQACAVVDQNLSSATLDVSDDDYQTWQTWGTFNLFSPRPMLNRGGSSRRRAFRQTQTDSFECRWLELELTASEGES
jgi:hypothetical protein